MVLSDSNNAGQRQLAIRKGEGGSRGKIWEKFSLFFKNFLLVLSMPRIIALSLSLVEIKSTPSEFPRENFLSPGFVSMAFRYSGEHHCE